jgi:hypothetical protein
MREDAMSVDIAIQRDLMTFKKNWARWSAGERLVAKLARLIASVAALSFLGQTG